MTAGASPGKLVDLAQASPPRLFFALLHQRFTGTLALQQPQAGQPPATRQIWFSGGMPIFTDWVHGPDVLGQILLEQRIVDDAALMRGLEHLARQGGLLGQVLVYQGALDETQLAAALRLQCARKLMHVFALREGQGMLTAGAHSLTQMDGINVLELMLAAVGRHYDPARVQAEMGPLLSGALRTTAAYSRYCDHFRFRPTDSPLLEAMQRGTTYEALVSIEGGPRRAPQLIYVLWAAQMLYTGAAAVQANAAAAANPARVAAKPRPAAPSKTAQAQPSQGTSAPPKPSQPTPAPTSSVPAPSTPPVAGDDEATFVSELEIFEGRVEEGANPFAMLGLGHEASRKEIRAAWSDLSRRLHPDALQAHGWDHLRERVNNVFAALSEANTTLSNKEERQRIAEAIERGEDPTQEGSVEAANMARDAFESELIAKEADRYLKANKFRLAAAEYQKALELTPEEPDLQAAAVWCAYNLTDRNRSAATSAEHQLGEIIKESPNLARAQMWRGHILREMGATEAAIVCYQRAYRSDNRLIEAQRFIRALNMAKKSTKDDKKRGLKGLFGKR